MKFISLFSGIGGFDMAFERADMVCDTVCEIDKDAQKVLRRHFPHARLVDDVRKVGKQSHERKSINLICGGFPCQDLSIAGKRAGLAGERSGLWFEFARIIDELEPQWVVIENVPGLLSSNKGRDFAVILYWLVKRGYGVCWRVLDAQYFGVPQRRRRVFIVASFGSGSAAEVLFERESGGGHPIQSRTPGKEVAYSLRANPSHSGDKGDGGVNTTLVAYSLSAHPTGRYEPTNDNFIVGSLQAHSKKHGHAMTTQQAAESNQLVIPPLRAAGGVTSNPTLNKNFTDLDFIIDGVRRLMPIECERLQGFPDGWTDGQSDSARYRQLGNAVAVPVASWLAQRIKAKACLTPREPDKGDSPLQAALFIPQADTAKGALS